MEFSLTNGYRLLTEDITLLYDIYMLCKNSRHYRRDGKTQYKDIARDYFDIVKFVIREESLDDAKLNYHIKTMNNDYVPRSNDYSSTYLYDTHIEGTGTRTRSGSNAPAPLIRNMDQLHAKQTIILLSWYYIRTVVLQFLFEEASQYPLWAGKVSVVLNDDIFNLCNPKNLVLGFWSPTGYPGNDVSLPRLWFSALKLRWENGLWEGLFPYLCAIGCLNLHTIVNWSQRFTLRSVVPYIYGRGHLSRSDSADERENFLLATPESSRERLVDEGHSANQGSSETGHKAFSHNDSLGNLMQHKNRERPKSPPDSDSDVSGSAYEPGDVEESENEHSDAGRSDRADSDASLLATSRGMSHATSGEFTWNINNQSRNYSSDGLAFAAGDSTFDTDGEAAQDGQEEDAGGKEGNSPAPGANDGGRSSGQGSTSSKERRRRSVGDWLQALGAKSISLPEFASRLVRSVLAHPFYMIALLMVKDQTLRYIASMQTTSSTGVELSSEDQLHASAVITAKDMNPLTLARSFNWSGSSNWLSVFLEIAAKKGFIFCLYRGLRSVIAANLLPFHLDYITGNIIQALLYRRMLRPVTDDELLDIRDLSRDVNSAKITATHQFLSYSSLTAGTRGIFVEAHSMISKHGAWSMMAYGYMTAMQTIPGFFNFLGARIFLFLSLGPSQVRERQIRRRKELLGYYFYKKREDVANDNGKAISDA